MLLKKQLKLLLRKAISKLCLNVVQWIGVSKREDMKNLIWQFQKEIPNVKANIYGAIKRSNIKGWN